MAQLKSHDLLPPDFACRSDGSYPLYRNGQFIDSLRGGAGTFLPIADVTVAKATQDEVRVYREFVRKHAGTWSVLDPLTLSLKRAPIPNKKGRERLDFVALVAPLQPSNASILLGILGRARDQRMAPSANALITLEAVFNRQLTGGPHDALVQVNVLDSVEVPPVATVRIMDLLGVLKQLDLRIFVQPGDAAFDRAWWQTAGTSSDPYWYGPFDLMGRKMKDHAAIAFDLAVLRAAEPTRQQESSDPAAQVWVRVGELAGSALDPLVASMAAIRAMKGSTKNVQQYHQWTSLLGLTTGQVPEIVASLVGLEPVCPLGGNYELVSHAAHGEHWRSTAWGEESLQVEDLQSYRPALLRWWHGLEAALTVDGGGLRVAGHLDVEFEMDEPVKMPLRLPFWNSAPSKPKPQVSKGNP